MDLTSLQALADKKGLSLSWDVGSDVGVINADLNRITQVLVNLISNAIRYTPENGEIVLRLCVVNPRTTIDDIQLIIDSLA